MSHFSSEELSLMDKMQKQKEEPSDVLKALVKLRRRRHANPPSSSAVYRYLGGETYCEKQETRGRETNFGRRELLVYDQQRRALQAKAKNEYVVTWDDIAEAGEKELRKRKLIGRSENGLASESLRKRMRAELDVGRRPAPQHPVRTEDEEKRRLRQGIKWKKYSKGFWVCRRGRGVHAYIDNKKFLMARTAKQRRRMRQARVRYHLRTAAERTKPGYTVPKKGREHIGIPSVEITAAVAVDRVIMWRVQRSGWCGAAAAEMYKDLGKALRRRWGSNKRVFRVVEDGDPKGYQSNKGIAAKAAQGIESMKLPPRSPEWMPLDYSLWKAIEDRMLEDTSVSGTESIAAYLARLEKTAKSLPRQLVKDTIAEMHKRISATVAEKGRHINYLD